MHRQCALRRPRLTGLVKCLTQLQQMKFDHTRRLLIKLGEAKARYRVV
jgi:hypothetical protein